jgi:cytochrome c oxidase subunit 3
MTSIRTYRAFNLNFTFSCIIYFIQLFEYISAPFSIFEVFMAHFFFLLTGFHGLHVILELFLIFVCFIRFLRRVSYTNTSRGFELAAWYWHFVDVIWLILFAIVYLA